MEKCQRCGTLVPSEQAFCQNCGATMRMADAGGAQPSSGNLAPTIAGPAAMPPQTNPQGFGQTGGGFGQSSAGNQGYGSAPPPPPYGGSSAPPPYGGSSPPPQPSLATFHPGPSNMPPAKKSRTGLYIGLGVGALLLAGIVVIGAGALIYSLSSASNTNNQTNQVNNTRAANTTNNTSGNNSTRNNRNGAADTSSDNARSNDNSGGDTGAGTDGGGATDLAGSTWSGTDSDGDFYRYELLQGGRFRVTDRSGRTGMGTWRANGSSVTMEAGGLTWRGTVNGNEMSGNGSTTNHRWTWTITRQ